MAFKRKEMKASRRLAENDIITRGVTVKIQQVAVRRTYENPSNDAKGEGTCKMRNEIETKRNEINRNEIHRNEMKFTETKRKRNETR